MNFFQCRTRLEMENRYGALIRTDQGRLAWPDETKWCEMLVIPPFASKQIINTAGNKPWTKVYCNKDISQPLTDTIILLHERGLLGEWRSYDGCYNLRDVRGHKGVPSTHCYAISIDINAAENPLGAESKLSKEFVAVWKELGWTWGGDWQRQDAQHFQWLPE